MSAAQLERVLWRIGEIEDAFSPSTGTTVWSRRIGGTGRTEGRALAIDPHGDIIVTGSFQGSVEFEEGHPLSSAGGTDIFVAKYSGIQGTHMWSRAFPGASDDEGRSVAVDPDGDVLLTGIFRETLAFDNTSGLTSTGDSDVFVAKLNGATGEHLWFAKLGGTGNDAAYGIAVDPNLRQTHFGVPYYEVLVAGAEKTVGVVVKYKGSDGSKLWSRTLGDDAEGRAVVVDRDGSVVVTGSFRGSLHIGGGPSTGSDCFLARLSGVDGSAQWSNSFDVGQDGMCEGIALDGVGDIFVVGLWQIETSNRLVFRNLAKFGANGPLLWDSMNGAARYHGVALFPHGDVVATGVADFRFSDSDMIVDKISGDTGIPIWSRTFGDDFSGDSRGHGVVADLSKVFVFGAFDGEVDFGKGPLRAVGTEDALLLKLRK